MTALWNLTNLTLAQSASVVNAGAVPVAKPSFPAYSNGAARSIREIVPDASEATLQKVIRGHISVESVINTDGRRGYHGLVDMGFAKHFRVRHGQNEFARGAQYINGIESFWSDAKHRLIQFHGVARHTFYLHLKETEFRFNHRHDDLYKVLLKMLRKDPLK